MKSSIIRIAASALFLSPLAFPLSALASPVPDWALTSVTAAPCTYWDGGNGHCLQWDSQYQFFPDYNSTLAGFKLYTDSLKDLDQRVAALESGAKPPIKSGSNEIPQWTLASVTDAPCTYWDGGNGRCLQWDSQYQFFPDYNSTLAGFQLYTDSVNGLDKRVAALEGAAQPPISSASNQILQWTLTSVTDAPCTYWDGGDGHCRQWDSQYQYFPDYNSTVAGFRIYTDAVNGLDARVSALEAKK
jgi:hypothetical protein